MGCVFETFALCVGAIAACVLAALYVYFKLSFTYWKKRNVPYVGPIFPYGNFADVLLFRKSIGHAYEEFYKKLDGKNYGGIYAFTKPMFILRDPDIVKNILVKDFTSFHDRGLFNDEEIEPLIGHLFFLPGRRWRNLRVKLSPTFTSGKMKMMFQTLVDCGKELVSILEKSSNNAVIIEIKEFLARYGTDVISSCAFGIQCNCLKNPEAEFRQWGRKVFALSIRNYVTGFLMQFCPRALSVLRLGPLDPKVSKYFRSMFEDTVSYRERYNITRNDFMQLLIQIKNKVNLEDENEILEMNDQGNLENKTGDCGISMNSLAAQAFVFFAGGFETSSSTMMFCMYELSLHQDIQDRLREEIYDVLQKHDGKLTYEGMQEMEYLDKVVSETLRKYPPVPSLNRECTKDYRIPGTDVVLEKGVATIIPVWALHYDPKYYPEPDRFDPERFSEDEKAKRHQYVYLPFGEGPRICIGMRFGLMQTKVGLISLLSKYQFCMSKKTANPLLLETINVVMAPVGGIWLHIKKRVKQSISVKICL